MSTPPNQTPTVQASSALRTEFYSLVPMSTSRPDTPIPKYSQRLRLSKTPEDYTQNMTTLVNALRTVGGPAPSAVNFKQNEQELHQNRIKEIRKQLDFLKETEWKYDPIEKIIGQS